jgi:cysteine desulfurase/selenocysteine lyase
VAYSFLETFAKPGDEVIVPISEHHSDFVPWQQLCRKRGMELRIVPVLPDGRLDLAAYQMAFTPRTRLVAAAHITNTFGVENPIGEMTRIAHAHGVPLLADGAQAAAHLPVNLGALGCDFYCVSAHKVYGPTGVGVLLARRALLENMEPFQYGGEMIREVTTEQTQFEDVPYRFEAGTPDFVGAVGFARALRFLQDSGGMEEIHRREALLGRELQERLRAIPGVKIPISAPDSAIVSFLVGDMHPLDTTVLLDQKKIAVRCGLHCAHPLMQALHLPRGTVRASLGIYNTEADLERLDRALRQIAALCGSGGRTMEHADILQDKLGRYAEQFRQLPDAFDRYTLLMQMAADFPEFTAEERREENRFRDCQSNLWLILSVREGNIQVRADSDTLIVKGLAGILADLLSGRPLEEVADTQLDFPGQLGLESILPAARTPRLFQNDRLYPALGAGTEPRHLCPLVNWAILRRGGRRLCTQFPAVSETTHTFLAAKGRTG